MIKNPVNINYCGTVVEIKNIISIDNCDNVVHTNIFGNSVIISKDVKMGDVGLFFPLETKLSNDFLKCNNLYRKQELNIDQTKKGYFEENGRIRCVKFRGNKSEGFFIPLNCIYNIFMDSGKLDPNWKKIGTEFDELNNIKICEKYIPKQFNLSSQGNGKLRNKNLVKRFNVLIDNQFRLHSDTSQLGKSIHRIKSDDIISITTKLHGTSGVSSNILCKRKLNIIEKTLIKLRIKIQDTEYKNIWSSRKVIKNQFIHEEKNKLPFNIRFRDLRMDLKKELAKNFYKEKYNKDMPEILYRKIFPEDNIDTKKYSNISFFENFIDLKNIKKFVKNYFERNLINHFYSEDIWSLANKKLKEYLQKGLTFYYEIVGYLPVSGKYIQKNYDYGCKEREFDIYIYRITYANIDGKVFEWSMKQVQDFCGMNGLKAVPLLYYGYVGNLFKELWLKHYGDKEKYKKIKRKYGTKKFDSGLLLDLLKHEYLEKDSALNIKPMPEEGVVVRIEKNDLEAYKLKSFKFLEWETKELDSGESNIDDNQNE